VGRGCVLPRAHARARPSAIFRLRTRIEGQRRAGRLKRTEE
jgi:hypothetical protein